MDLPARIRVVDDHDPDADVRLVRELYAGLPMPVPDLERKDHEEAERPASLVVARRPDGALLGWAEVHARGDGTSVADLQWLLVSRERERITQGHNVLREATAEERDVVTRLVRGAADSAGRAGYTALDWDDPEGHLDARAAAELGASEAEVLGRRWKVAPLAGWTAPPALPAVTVRPVPHFATEALLPAYADFYTEATGQPYNPRDAEELLHDLPSLPHLTLDLLTPEGTLAAQATAMIDGETATVDMIFHRRGVSAGQLTALLATLIGQLRGDHPEVTLLDVQEFGDTPVAEALAAAGARIADRWHRYRLPLREDRTNRPARRAGGHPARCDHPAR
ncbi:hypothetical protein ACO0M4_08120 [Streptomyces sp. RGM 3693]|uniref:hypothetical protein n=1 Tax=Streptomyces sp. RGM 3693 TaxID=3413284 RepID=UPI003D2E5C97